jgi:hypothetical protein
VLLLLLLLLLLVLVLLLLVLRVLLVLRTEVVAGALAGVRLRRLHHPAPPHRRQPPRVRERDTQRGAAL